MKSLGPTVHACTFESNKIIKRTANWKAPGIDQVQNFWIKHLTALHERLTQALEKTINNPQHAPTWITQGRTTLIHKNGPTSEAKNYRPITCLPTYYKLATLILTERIYEHVTTNQIIMKEVKSRLTILNSEEAYSKAIHYRPHYCSAYA